MPDRGVDTRAGHGLAARCAVLDAVTQALVVGDFGAAADIFAGIKTPAFEAFYRLQSGNEQDVRAALEFYRRVDATRYLRQGEAMLAASA